MNFYGVGETYMMFVDIFRNYYINNMNTINIHNKCENTLGCNNEGRYFLITYPKYNTKYVYYVCDECVIKFKKNIMGIQEDDEDAREPKVIKYNSIIFELLEQINFDNIKNTTYQIIFPIHIDNELNFVNSILNILNNHITEYLENDIEYENEDGTITTGNFEDEYIEENKIKLSIFYILHSFIRSIFIYDIENDTNQITTLSEEIIMEHNNVLAIYMIQTLKRSLGIIINENEWLDVMKFLFTIIMNVVEC